MYRTPEHGNRTADIQAARAAEGIGPLTKFVNYGKVEGAKPVPADALADIWDDWAIRGVEGTSEVPHHTNAEPFYAAPEITAELERAARVAEGAGHLATVHELPRREEVLELPDADVLEMRLYRQA